jgi:hypothetical protein
MSIHPAPADGSWDGNSLFTPGPRLGWVFRDRAELAVPYAEPEPDPRAMHARMAGQAAAADQTLATAWKWLGRPGIIVAVVLAIVALAEVTDNASPAGPLIAIVVLCLPAVGWTAWCWLRRDQLRDASPERDYRQALAAWRQRAAAHQAAEAGRLAGQPQWGSLLAPAPRTDVFGGTLAGWQGLLTVHGASLVAERPVLVADLSGQHAAQDLMLAAQQAGVSATAFRLPQDLGRAGLLADLTPSQLAVAIAEAIHHLGPNGTGPGPNPSARSDQALDARVLQQLAAALSGRGVTPQRLAAAVQAALGSTGNARGGILSDEEADRIAGDLFPARYRDQVMASLIRLDAILAGLAAFAAGGWPAKPARLTCVVVDPSVRGAPGEVLTSLLVQWLTVQVSAAPAGQPAPAVILIGADEVARAHAERLADTCEWAGVPLTLLFRHLRNDAISLLGGGTAAFMRLGNHAEAEQAATYIGRQHTFVVSSHTATRGGSLTATHGTSDSYGSGENASRARTGGWSDRPDGGLLSGHAHSGGRTGTTGTSTSQTRGTSWSGADGTSWTDAEVSQRVYEFTVEPTVLQGLPDYALLVADRSARGLQLRTVECDPAIISLPGATIAPLPPSQAGPRYGGGPYVSPPLAPVNLAPPMLPPVQPPLVPPGRPPVLPPAAMPRPPAPVPGQYAAAPPTPGPYPQAPYGPGWDPGNDYPQGQYAGYPPPPGPAPPAMPGPPRHQRPPGHRPEPPAPAAPPPPEEPELPWWQHNPHG